MKRVRLVLGSGGARGMAHIGVIEELEKEGFQIKEIVGCSMGAHLPKEIIIVGIEAKSVYDFSEELSAPVAAALPKAINLVMELIK